MTLPPPNVLREAPSGRELRGAADNDTPIATATGWTTGPFPGGGAIFPGCIGNRAELVARVGEPVGGMFTIPPGTYYFCNTVTLNEGEWLNIEGPGTVFHGLGFAGSIVGDKNTPEALVDVAAEGFLTAYELLINNLGEPGTEGDLVQAVRVLGGAEFHRCIGRTPLVGALTVGLLATGNVLDFGSQWEGATAVFQIGEDHLQLTQSKLLASADTTSNRAAVILIESESFIGYACDHVQAIQDAALQVSAGSDVQRVSYVGCQTGVADVAQYGIRIFEPTTAINIVDCYGRQTAEVIFCLESEVPTDGLVVCGNSWYNAPDVGTSVPSTWQPSSARCNSKANAISGALFTETAIVP